jgi:hypothetical protein
MEANINILSNEVIDLCDKLNIEYNSLNNSKSNEIAFTSNNHAKREFEIKFMASGTYRVSTRYLGYKNIMKQVTGNLFVKNDSDGRRKLFYVEFDNVLSVNDLLVQMLSYGYDINPKIENI